DWSSDVCSSDLDDGHRAALRAQPLHDAGNRLRGRLVVDGDAHDLAAGVGQGTDLLHGRVHVGRVRVGHRLDYDRMVSADKNAADVDHAAAAPAPAGRRGAPVVAVNAQALAARALAGAHRLYQSEGR